MSSNSFRAMAPRPLLRKPRLMPNQPSQALSDSSGVLAQTALSARNAVGVTGMLVALGVCAGPAARLGAHMLSLKLASALIEPVADPGVSRIAAAYGEVARLLLALCAAGGLLSALLLGTGLGLLGF